MVINTLCELYPAHSGGRGGESERERGAGGLSCQRDEITRRYGGTTERATRPGNNSKQRRRMFFMQFDRINVIFYIEAVIPLALHLSCYILLL